MIVFPDGKQSNLTKHIGVVGNVTALGFEEQKKKKNQFSSTFAANCQSQIIPTQCTPQAIIAADTKWSNPFYTSEKMKNNRKIKLFSLFVAPDECDRPGRPKCTKVKHFFSSRFFWNPKMAGFFTASNSFACGDSRQRFGLSAISRKQHHHPHQHHCIQRFRQRCACHSFWVKKPETILAIFNFRFSDTALFWWPIEVQQVSLYSLNVRYQPPVHRRPKWIYNICKFFF